MSLEAREGVITVGQLRQNPSKMIHDVRMGRTYTLTDRGVPTAQIIPFQSVPQAVPLADVLDLISQPDLPGWRADRRAFRDAFEPRDPWARDDSRGQQQ
jgi:antitoxin (DNA-binding transcriptional repressor) of toxin-antitoxin stability system